MDFKEVYKLPFKLYNYTVLTNDMKRAFDFNIKALLIHLDDVVLSPKQKELIVDKLNGKTTTPIIDVSYKSPYLYIKDKCIAVVRGWGYLVGTGGLNLPEEEAAKIQDDFGNWIVETLTK